MRYRFSYVHASTGSIPLRDQSYVSAFDIIAVQYSSCRCLQKILSSRYMIRETYISFKKKKSLNGQHRIGT